MFHNYVFISIIYRGEKEIKLNKPGKRYIYVKCFASLAWQKTSLALLSCSLLKKLDYFPVYYEKKCSPLDDATRHLPLSNAETILPVL
jgi:hypothetical protein